MIEPLVSDFQSAWIDRVVFSRDNGKLYRARQILRMHPNCSPKIETQAVLDAERVATRMI
jgi:hypothetical protein